MLEQLRRGAGTWVAKIFIALLVLSFAVWGIADIFSGYRGTAVATVGEVEVDVEEFRRQFQIQVQNESRDRGVPISYDVARAVGMDRQVLGRLVAEAALDDTSRKLGLGLTDEAIAHDIRRDPAFRGAGGTFDRAYFDAAIRSIGFSEAGYIHERRRLMGRQAIADAVGAEIDPPEQLNKILAQYRFETRQFRYFVVGNNEAGAIEAATEDQLRSYFEENKPDFRAPEYREIKAIKIEPADLSGGIEVSDTDIEATYESQKDRYTQPERRRVQQMVFDTADEAAAVAAEVAGGKSLTDIAFEKGISPDDLELGLVAQSDIADPAVADLVFALEKGASTQPIEGRFGHVIASVVEIVTGGTKPLEEVRDEIRNQIAEGRAEQELLDLHDAIEDDRAGGSTLAEIAQKKNLGLISIAAIDAEGKAPDGTDIDLPEKRIVLQTAFESDVGIENDPAQIGANGLIWFDVTSVTPSRDRTFDEARTMVETAWKADAERQKLDEFANGLLEKIRGGADLDEVARDTGVPIIRSSPLGRAADDADFSNAAINHAFGTPEGEFAVAPASDNRRLIFKVVAVTMPQEATEPLPDNVAQDLKEGFTDDMLSQYLEALQNSLEVTINQQLIDQALGVSQPGAS